MKKNFRFIHTADLHLGRPVSSGGKPPERLKEIFNNAGYETWENICDLAIDREVDCVLISGDLYDREARSVKAGRIFSEQCRRLEEAGIKIYVISGNHDPMGRKKEPFSLPQNVHIFSSEEVENILQKAENYEESSGNKDSCRGEIIGQSYRSKFESRKMYTYYTPEKSSDFKLGLLHTQLDPGNKRYVPVSRQDLLAKNNLDYWALGHIHEPQVIKPSLPAILYSGTPQARSIKETGVKGCFLIELIAEQRQKSIRINFAPSASVIFVRMHVDITRENNSLNNLSDLENLLKQKAQKFLQRDFRSRINFPGSEKVNIIDTPAGMRPKGFVVRWLVSGRSSIHELIAENREEAEKELSEQLNRIFAAAAREPFLWTHSLQFRLNPELPEIKEIEDNEIYREIESIIEKIKDDEDLQEELRNEWGKIWQGAEEPEERRNDRFYPDIETTEDILQAAHQQIIAHLFSSEN